jgi:molybdopterin biosynthesis enzyme
MKESVRNRFIASVQQKLGWFEAEILGVVSALDKTEDLTRHMQAFKEQGAELVLHVGGHASDPLDPIFETITQIGARMERKGAPAHPGSLFWLAYLDEMAIFGLASCGMFSRTTLGDLFLAKFFAGERITSRDLAKVGHGGLFTHEMDFRFPSYS